MNPLSLIPDWLKLVAFGLLLAALGTQTVRLANEKTAHAQTKTAFSEERVQAAEDHSREMAVQHEEFERRIGEKDANIEAAKALAAARGASLADARRAGDGLQIDLAAAIARADQAGRNPDAGARGEATPTSAGVFGGLFKEADGFAEILAGALAASRDAGATCERSYNSLTP